MDNYYDLVKGAYDLHQHSGPDVMPRKIDDLELSKRFIKAGMGGYVIKSHYNNSAERAYYANLLYPECKAIGAITLNNTVGGLNPVAVEMAGREGAKIIWFPTFDGKREQEFLFGSGRTDIIYPYWAKIIKELEHDRINSPQISLLDEKGKLKDVVIDIIDLSKKHNMVLATSHLSHEETFALAKAIHERGVKKFIVTHVLYPSTVYTIDEQKELINLGGIVEYCYSTITTGKTSLEATLNGIRGVGYENCLISSDLGQMKGCYPDEGMIDFARILYENGFTPDQIQRMNRDNPKWLLEL